MTPSEFWAMLSRACEVSGTTVIAVMEQGTSLRRWW